MNYNDKLLCHTRHQGQASLKAQALLKTCMMYIYKTARAITFYSTDAGKIHLEFIEDTFLLQQCCTFVCYAIIP